MKIVKEMQPTLLYDALRFMRVSSCLCFSTTRSGLSMSRIKRSLYTVTRHSAQHRSLVEHGCEMSTADHGGAEESLHGLARLAHAWST